MRLLPESRHMFAELQAFGFDAKVFTNVLATHYNFKVYNGQYIIP